MESVLGHAPILIAVILWEACRVVNPAYDGGKDGGNLDSASGTNDGRTIDSFAESGLSTTGLSNGLATSENSTGAEGETGNTVSSGTVESTEETRSTEEVGSTGDDDSSELCAQFSEDLIACYNFEKIPGSDKIMDRSDHGNHMLVSNAELSPMGYSGNALICDNELEAYLEDEVIFDLDGFTLSMSVFPHSFPPMEQVGFLDNDLQYALLIENGSLLCNDGNGSISASVPPLDEWTTIVCTSDRSTMRLYLNGELVNEDSIDGARGDNRNRISIANMSPGFDKPFLGLLDSLRVWSRALSFEEVAELGSD